jgi:hypothetical protein
MEAEFLIVLSWLLKILAGTFFCISLLISLRQTIRNPIGTENEEIRDKALRNTYLSIIVAIICMTIVLIIDDDLSILAAFLSGIGLIMVMVLSYCIQRIKIGRGSRHK